MPDNDSFNRPINALAQAWADEHAGDLIAGLSESTRERVNEIIARGLEQGLSADELSELLQDSYEFSEERADLIALTEAQIANGAGQVDGLRAARDAGLLVKKEWIPDPDACDICQENADAGPIDVDDLFPSGDDAEPAHPNCRCYTQGVVIEDEDVEEPEEEDEAE